MLLQLLKLNNSCHSKKPIRVFGWVFSLSLLDFMRKIEIMVQELRIKNSKMRKKISSWWSILIWVVFLGLFIAIFFITFQLRLGRLIELSNETSQKEESRTTFSDALESLKSNPRLSVVISDNESLESLEYRGNKYSAFLRQNEKKEYFINSGSTNPLPFSLSEWWPIHYEVDEGGTITDSGSIFLSGSIKISSVSNLQKITIENLGGYAKIGISVWDTDLRPKTVLYRHIKSRAEWIQVLGLYER